MNNNVYNVYSRDEYIEIYNTIHPPAPYWVELSIIGSYKIRNHMDNVEILTEDIEEEYDLEVADSKPCLEGYCDATYDPTECKEPNMYIISENEDGTKNKGMVCEEVLSTLDVSDLDVIYILPEYYPYTSLDTIYSDTYSCDIVNVYELSQNTINKLSPTIINAIFDDLIKPQEYYDNYRDSGQNVFDKINTRPNITEDTYYMIHNRQQDYIKFVYVTDVKNNSIEERTVDKEEICEKFTIDSTSLTAKLL